MEQQHNNPMMKSLDRFLRKKGRSLGKLQTPGLDFNRGQQALAAAMGRSLGGTKRVVGERARDPAALRSVMHVQNSQRNRSMEQGGNAPATSALQNGLAKLFRQGGG